VHRVKEIKYPKVFDRLPQGVHAIFISRLEVARESSRGLMTLKYLKGHGVEVTSQKLISSLRTLGCFMETQKRKSNS